uniref:(northern house mosquito) hypothetical protein n=1 Tax=Culex pipiens TaxID=7175 RepID=A0A8D8IQK8_CULPI
MKQRIFRLGFLRLRYLNRLRGQINHNTPGSTGTCRRRRRRRLPRRDKRLRDKPVLVQHRQRRRLVLLLIRSVFHRLEHKFLLLFRSTRRAARAGTGRFRRAAATARTAADPLPRVAFPRSRPVPAAMPLPAARFLRVALVMPVAARAAAAVMTARRSMSGRG